MPIPWTAEPLPSNKLGTLRLAICQTGTRLGFGQVFENWTKDADFRTFYIDLLASTPYEALFWETPPVTLSTVEQPYEFIVTDSPSLASVRPDPTAFASHFRTATSGESVIAFENLGGDAMLVVPCPVGDESAYPHLAAFVRNAPVEQKHQFFQRLGAEVAEQVGNHPLWISTSGLGVYWLHARLDSVPKYYTYAAYRRADYAT